MKETAMQPTMKWLLMSSRLKNLPYLLLVWQTQTPGKKQQNDMDVTSLQVYPNPAFHEFSVRYYLKEDASNVSLFIYSLSGRLIAMPLNGKAQKQGPHTIKISSDELSPGIYLCPIVV